MNELTTKEETKATQAEPVQKNEIMASEDGKLVGSNLNEQWRLAKLYCASGMLPKAYKTPEQVLIGIQYAYELGLNPLSALKNIAVVNGQPTLWGELPLAIVRNSGKLERIREYTINDKYEEISIKNKNLGDEIFAAVCVIKRQGHEEQEYFFTRDMFKKQGGGVAAIWNQYESIMFKRKARSIAIKDQFGDMLEGMNIAEYDFNRPVEAGKEYNLNHDGTDKKESSSNTLNSISTTSKEITND